MSKKDIIRELIQQTLDAIQEENKIIWEHDDHIPQIELDLIMSNIRKLYENYLLLNRLNQSKQITSLEDDPETEEEVGNWQLAVGKEEEEVDSEQRSEAESVSGGQIVDKEEEPVEEIIDNEEEGSGQRNEVESVSGGLAEGKKEEDVGSEEHIEEESGSDELVVDEEEEELKPAMKFGIGFTPLDETEEEEEKEADSEQRSEAEYASGGLIVDREEEDVEPAKDELPKPPVSSFDLFSDPGETVADKFTSNEKTVNDQLVKEENNTVADKIQQNPIEDLKSFIGINDRFIFMRDLFDGQLKDYNEAIEKLNNQSHLKDAIDYFNELKEKYGMDELSDSFKKLYNYIQRKYS